VIARATRVVLPSLLGSARRGVLLDIKLGPSLFGTSASRTRSIEGSVSSIAGIGSAWSFLVFDLGSELIGSGSRWGLIGADLQERW
jgi:hypothetical protein